MNPRLVEAKQIIEKEMIPEYTRLEDIEGYKYMHEWKLALETVLEDMDRQVITEEINKILNKIKSAVPEIRTVPTPASMFYGSRPGDPVSVFEKTYTRSEVINMLEDIKNSL